MKGGIPLKIIISNAKGEPIYEQIYKQMKDMIIAGKLKEGDMLPSIRGLAKDLRISVITTKRAYDELEKRLTYWAEKYGRNIHQIHAREEYPEEIEW